MSVGSPESSASQPTLRRVLGRPAAIAMVLGSESASKLQQIKDMKNYLLKMVRNRWVDSVRKLGREKSAIIESRQNALLLEFEAKEKEKEIDSAFVLQRQSEMEVLYKALEDLPGR